MRQIPDFCATAGWQIENPAMRSRSRRHYIATLLESLRSVSKLSPRGVSGSFPQHTIRLKLLFRMLAMAGHFFSEFAADIFATNENPHLSKETSNMIHGDPYVSWSTRPMAALI